MPASPWAALTATLRRDYGLEVQESAIIEIDPGTRIAEQRTTHSGVLQKFSLTLMRFERRGCRQPEKEIVSNSVAIIWPALTTASTVTISMMAIQTQIGARPRPARRPTMIERPIT